MSSGTNLINIINSNTLMTRKKDSESIVKKAFTRLGIRNNISTDPKTISKVMAEFRINDLKTENKVMNRFFEDALNKPQKLKPLIDCVQKNITDHPAIVEFLEIAIKNGWLRESEHVNYAVHVTYVLEALTVAMCNDHDFFVEVEDHYRKHESPFGIDTKYPIRTFLNALGITKNFFGTVKALSVDPAMIYFRIQRGFTGSHVPVKEARRLYNEKKINYVEYKLVIPLAKNGLEHINSLVRANIYEAEITEYKRCYIENAFSAHTLNEEILLKPPITRIVEKKALPSFAQDKLYKNITKKHNLFPEIRYSQDWTSLYTSWNMAFVLGDIDNLDIVMPKLVIPSIIGAKPENYIGARIISLWLTVHHAFFRLAEKKNLNGPKNREEMTKAWGEINKKYALKLTNKNIGPEELEKSFKRFFRFPMFNWIDSVKRL